jgi:hypothetical protein
LLPFVILDLYLCTKEIRYGNCNYQ